MKIFEYVQVNSQLLDTVQHKVRLSEQLEEMEVNIVDQIQDQVAGSRYLDVIYTIYISTYLHIYVYRCGTSSTTTPTPARTRPPRTLTRGRRSSRGNCRG